MDIQLAFQELSENLLNNDTGLSEMAYQALLDFGIKLGVDISPITSRVKATDGYFYYPE